jgi:adenosylcobinamide-phosphate synthase
VFGAFFWFVALAALGLGPAGAVLYRLTAGFDRWLAQRARIAGLAINPNLLTLAQRAFLILDHVPARMTAFGFAVVGNFEQAIAGWRRDAWLWAQPNEGVILAAAAGAVGVQLGGTAAASPHGEAVAEDAAAAPAAPAFTPGLAPRNAHLDSVVGLVWRSVVLWMLLLALLTVANVLG